MCLSGAFSYRFIPSSSTEEGEKTTFLLLHGTGGNEESLIPLAREIDACAAELAVRGRVLENGMPRFFRRFAEGVFDVEDLKYRARELAEFVRISSKNHSFSLESVVALGYSNGANIGAALLLLHPDVVCQAILLRPMLPLMPDTVPDLSDKRVFISAGENDRVVPRQTTVDLEELLKSAGAHVTVNWEKSDHGLTRSELEKAKLWLSGQK
jgi:phospholipase/carboxylesterase